MTAEGGQTPGGEPGSGGAYPPGLGPEGSARRTEGDLLAERRARRAAESPDSLLTRRAEAAEATVQTLETHVASLRDRLRDAEEERRRLSELLDDERASFAEPEQGHGGQMTSPAPRGRVPADPAWRSESSETAGHESPSAAAINSSELMLEHELRRVQQREYAEQQLRIDAENRCIDLDRRSRAEIDRLNHRLGSSERDARTLASRLESVQRALAEAEQAAATERVVVRRAERELQMRLVELEHRAAEIHSGLDSERAARERAERLLENMRRGHRQVQGLLGELRGMVGEMSAMVQSGRSESPARPPGQDALVAEDHRRHGPPPAAGTLQSSHDAPVSAGGEAPAPSREPALGSELAPPASSAAADRRGSEMKDALAAAAERLRARAEGASEGEVGERGAVAEARQTPVAMSPSQEPLLPGGRISWWVRWRAWARSRRQR